MIHDSQFLLIGASLPRECGREGGEGSAVQPEVKRVAQAEDDEALVGPVGPLGQLGAQGLLGPNSIEIFWLEKSLEFRLEIPYTEKR